MRIPSYGYRGRSRSRGGLGGRLPIIGLVILGLAFYWFSNQKTGITGRNQMITMSVEDEVRLGDQSYAQILRSENVLCDRGATSCPADAGEIVNVIELIGEDIADAAVDWEQDLVAEGRIPSWGTLADKFDWEFKVIQSDTPNAFCLPGGKVAFYTGILPTAQNRNGIAVIMGHEVGHALARHGAERMSQQKVMQLGQVAVGASMSGSDAGTQRMVMGAFGMGAQVGVLLPFSRSHESEADMIGLELLTRACYDPREAPELWRRMAQLGGGQRQPEMLSTHPDPEARAADFEKVMPHYIEMYERKCGPLPAR
ncbi:MAG: M48 family metallopeptidase [Pseudomonadota bacterium]